ncbi:acyltransferase family protein [Flagellimonas pacifica]|uniref:Peptidoglycan/LPS O-acetylase OafA/YrhL, contains acyltransferase and SGNH-hydrolase domains n=1 Tax=Flagellimonas pacifica TaxID=1247520 RepID=A0A285MQJ9_9FLAO|nr:acyltransferase [Allomuricauda parva]SNY99462.1 Peptidoglycan/LPS O-acetylase OafA/YrhL, contains acyltransferase and SGNH-hydrolase domains [Allomuricauda parva]
MKTQETIKKDRKYFIDWLRIALIISVFFFHVGMIFRPEQWHVNSKESFAFLDPIMWWLHLWRMPLLFLVSGVGTYYAIGHRTSWQYVKERFRRLYIPFTVGFFTLVPLMVYVERIDVYDSLWDFIPHIFDGGPYPVGNISWHHLWFILYLFIISLLIAPFLNYTKSGHYNMVRGKMINLVTKKMGLNWLLPIIILSQVILRQYFPNSTHALYNDWAYFTYYLLFFLSGFILFTSDKLITSLTNDRRLYLYQTLAFTLILFSLPSIFGKPSVVQDYTLGITEMIISLSCGLTAIGYFKKYFNKDYKYRKVLNEAIYPFYLLHQPALIFVGHVVLQWEISYGMQAILITILSLISIYLSYWFVIRKVNVLRIAFGMKSKAKEDTAQMNQLERSPVFDK